MHTSSNFGRLSGLLLIGVLMLLLSIQGVNVQAGLPSQATSAAGEAAATQGAGGVMRYPACTPTRLFGTGGGAATPSAGGPAATPSVGGTGTGNAYLGIRGAAVDSCGIQVAEVFVNSPAAAADLQVDDVIVAVDGQALPTVLMNSMNTGGTGTSGAGAAATQGAGAVATAGAAATIAPGAMLTEFFRFMDQMHKPGDMVMLTIQRNGSEMDIPVTLAALPGSAGAGSTGGAAATATTAR